jgi:predicted aconitase with swiveling domain
MRVHGLALLRGAASGEALAADVPLSFWGGFDPETGAIIDMRHPLAGENATGRVLVLPAGRGSCSGSGVLLEAIRNGTAPAAIVTSRVDVIIALGAILGDELYAKGPVTIVIPENERRAIGMGDLVAIDEEGWLRVSPRRS